MIKSKFYLKWSRSDKIQWSTFLTVFEYIFDSFSAVSTTGDSEYHILAASECSGSWGKSPLPIVLHASWFLAQQWAPQVTARITSWLTVSAVSPETIHLCVAIFDWESFFKQAKTMFIGIEVQLWLAGTQPAALKLVPALTTYQDHFLDRSGWHCQC